MESTTETTHEGVDRLSQLPDPILHHILSEMSTRELVRTMILSKRWRNLWASVPSLFFGDYKSGIYDDDERFSEFIRFVNTVLLLRDALDIHTFSLRWKFSSIPTGHHLNTWIQHAVVHNVKELEINARTGKYFSAEYEDLPDCLFTCQTLEKLKLVVCETFVLKAPKFIGLGQLRKLHFDRISIEGDSLKRIISGSPILEDLQMNIGDLTDPCISSCSLKRLSISNYNISATVVQISCPSLQSLWFAFNDIDTLKVLLEDLSSLVDASIQIEEGYRYYALKEPVKPLKFVTSRSQCLSEDKPSEDMSLPTFHNLKKLTLIGDHMETNFQTVAKFLQCSPKLELLKLNKEFVTGSEIKCWRHYDCMHVKMNIEIVCGKENERLAELIDEFYASKCDCPESDYDSL